MDTLVAQALEKALTGINSRKRRQLSWPRPRSRLRSRLPRQRAALASRAPRPPSPLISGRATPWKLFGISSGVAPMIATGPAADYTKLGLLTTFAVDLRFRAGGLEAGVLTGACWMSATGVVSTASILIIPMGVDLQYLLNSGAFPGIILHASGGPAFMSVNASYTGTETKIVPYVLGGLTLDLPFDPSLGLTVQANYVAFLESSLAIMAFAPEVSLYVRL